MGRHRVQGVVPEVQGVLPLELGLVVEHVRVHPVDKRDHQYQRDSDKSQTAKSILVSSSKAKHKAL